MTKKIQKKSKSNKKEQITKQQELEIQKKNKNIFYLVLAIVDVVTIIYFARHNIVNYVKVGEKTVLISSTKNLLLGKNYIVLITSAFFYIYTIVTRKILFKQNLTKKFVLLLLAFIFGLNIALFYLFTKKIV